MLKGMSPGSAPSIFLTVRHFEKTIGADGGVKLANYPTN